MRGPNIDPSETPVIFWVVNSLTKLVKYHLCCGVQVSINKIYGLCYQKLFKGP